jgi:hypothetical protein
MGFFGKVKTALKEGEAKASDSYKSPLEKLKEREDKADADLMYNRRLDKVRGKEKETRALKLKPVKEKIGSFKANLKALKQKSQGTTKSSIYGRAYGSETSDRTREIFGGSSRNPFYDEPKQRKKKKSKGITIRIN